MIVGSSGSGKSTLAQRLGAKLGLPVYHMDREVHWLPGWVARPEPEKPALVEAIAARDAWIFEGGHSASYEARLVRADLLIWIDAPLGCRLWRVTSRSVRGLGKTRPDLAENCPETLRNLPGFWRYLWVSRHRTDARLKTMFARATLPKRKLSGLAEINAFLEEL